MNDYARIEKAMAFMVANAAQQPSLDTIAAQVHLSGVPFSAAVLPLCGRQPKALFTGVDAGAG